MNGSLFKVRQVHRNLSQSTNQKSRTLYKSQSTSGKAHRFGNFLCDLNIRSIQKDVVRDQKFARPYYRSSSSRMNARLSKIRTPCRISGNLIPNSLKLSATDVLQVLTFRCGRRSLV